MLPNAGPNDTPAGQTQEPVPEQHHTWHTIRNRLFEGLLFVLPILFTFWMIRWLYSGLEKYVIDPLAVLVIWKAQKIQGQPDLPYWFETFAAPIISLILVVLLVYLCGVIAHTQFRKYVDQLLLKVPVVSHIYDAARGVMKVFDKPAGKQMTYRMVLVPFPHTGMRLPAIVTSTCIDVATGKKLLCVYVPTTPVPASGFFLMLPEEEATELNWDVQQTLQTIISGGLTAPPQVTYYKAGSTVMLGSPPQGGMPVAAGGEGQG
jgi:uncharacterized membrane protein